MCIKFDTYLPNTESEVTRHDSAPLSAAPLKPSFCPIRSWREEWRMENGEWGMGIVREVGRRRRRDEMDEMDEMDGWMDGLKRRRRRKMKKTRK